MTDSIDRAFLTAPLFPSQWLLLRLHQQPDSEALLGRERFTYAQLAEESMGLAACLQGKGVQSRQVVAAQVSSSWQLARLFYASLQLGVTLLPLDPSMDSERRNRLLQHVGCDGFISAELTALPGATWISSDELFDGNSDGAAHFDADVYRGEDIQLIIATSGTTGDPKGVMLSGGNLAASASASEQRLGLAVGDSWLACLPLFHIGGLSILLRCLAVGARVLLHEGFRVDSVWDQIAAGEVTHISLVPAMLDKLLIHADSQRPPEVLRVVLIGGGPLSGALAAKAHAAGWPLCVSYGMSETASQFATDAGPDAGLIAGLVGLPLDGYEVRLAEDGRIRVRGPAVMAGYSNPAGRLGVGLDQGWFETGDLGSLDEQGHLSITGRADDLLISGGKNIHPSEVEERLLRCPGVAGAGVTGQKDAVWGDKLIAFYCGAITEDGLKAWVGEHLPSHLRPRAFIKTDQLPLNPMGKLSRLALKEMLNAVNRSAEGSSPT
jgi:O-succinylbenzoic acid--CoA ligase